MTLTPTERLILLNQYRILELISSTDPEQASDSKRAQTMLQWGYTLEYDNLLGAAMIAEGEFAVSDCREVLDILDMYREVRRVDRNIAFPGFDGNSETGHLGYARFLVEDGRYEGLLDDSNSHAPMLPGYRAMLTKWNESNDRFNLTREDVVRIFGGI